MSIIAAVRVPATFQRAAPSAVRRCSCLCIRVSRLVSGRASWRGRIEAGESGDAPDGAPPSVGEELPGCGLRLEREVVLEGDAVVDAQHHADARDAHVE